MALSVPARNLQIRRRYIQDGAPITVLARDYELSKVRIWQILDAAGVRRGDWGGAARAAKVKRKDGPPLAKPGAGA